MTLAPSLHRAARAFEQRPGCGCAKRQAAMNAVVPGSGDAVKAVASGIAAGLHKAATLIGPKPRPRVWTAPPEIPEGWEMVEECWVTALYRKGPKFIIWDRIDGQYRNSHTVCCGAPEIARREFEKRCRS